MLLGQINLPLIIGTITPFYKVTILMNIDLIELSFTGQKPHECHICGKRFALGCNMKAHLKTHDPNRGNVKIEDPSEELLNVTD